MITNEYAAGFFDGEGTVYAATRKRSRTPTVIVCISNTNLDVLEMHKARWGGSISERKRVKENHQRQFQWVICTKNARRFLEDVTPHLVIKKKVASLALEMLDMQARPYSERFDHSMPNGRLLKDDYIDGIVGIFEKMRACNSSSAPSNARRAYGLN